MGLISSIPVIGGTLATALGQQEEDPYTLGKQKELGEQMRVAAMGGAPSAADATGKMMADQLVAQQYAMANSQPGVAPAAALRQASLGASSIGTGMAGQAAARRAEEQERARQVYAQMLQAQRAASLQHQQMNAQALGGTLGGAGAAYGASQR